MRLPLLHKMPIQRPKVSSHPFPPPLPCSPISYWLFWKLAYSCQSIYGTVESLVSEILAATGKSLTFFYSVAPYQYCVRIVSIIYLALVELLLASQESLSLEHRRKRFISCTVKERGRDRCLYLCQVTVSLAEVVRVEPRDSWSQFTANIALHFLRKEGVPVQNICKTIMGKKYIIVLIEVLIIGSISISGQ